MLSTVVLLLVFINLVINFPAIQTWLCKGVADYYSSKWHTKVIVGRVDFGFIKKLVLKNVYVQDQHSDTLLYAEALNFDIGSIDFKEHILHLSNIDIEHTKFHLTTYKNAHELSLQFIIDAFASKDTLKRGSAKWDVSTDALTLDDVDFRYQNLNDTESVNGINPMNLRVHHINSKISDIKFEGDTLRATIERLSALEQCGFELKRMSCFVKLSSRGMELDALNILTPQTSLSTDLVFRYKAFRDFDDFVNKVNMRASFKKSTLCFEDLAYFAPGLKAVHNCFDISGLYTGTVSHLHGKNMTISWGQFSSFEGEADMNGLPDIDKTVIKVNVASLVTSKKEIETLPRPPFDMPGNIKLPDNIEYLNTMHFSGNFNGYISDFNADGILITDIGTIVAALHLRQDTLNKTTYYKGILQTQEFNIGRFLSIKDMGAITSSVTIEGKGLRKDNADARIDGSMQSLYYKKYAYKNTSLNGELRKGFFSGILQVNDPNLHMDFNGEIDLVSPKHHYKFDSRIYNADLTAMHIIGDTSSPALLSCHIKIDAEGNSLDEITGTLNMDSTRYSIHKQLYHLNYFNMTSEEKDGYRAVSITSDYVDANVSGHYSLLNSPRCFEGLLACYLPDKYLKEPHLKNGKDFHDYNYNIRFKENTGLTDLFIPSLKITQGTFVKGYYKEKTNNFFLLCQSPLVEWNGRKAKALTVNVNGDSKNLIINANSDTLNISDSLYAQGFNIYSNIADDSVHYRINWNNDTNNYANIPGFIAFTKSAQTVFKLLDPVIDISDSAWQLNKQNLLVIDSSGTTAKDIMFSHNQQYISIMGKLSNKRTDAMVVDFHKFNLEDILVTSPSLKGIIDGTASISNANNRLLFVSALNFNNVYFNKEYIGDGTINSYWDNTSQSIATNGQVMYHDDKSLSFLGNYYPAKDSENISIDATLHGFHIKPLNYYMKGICSEMDGGISGGIHISGNLNKPVFRGNVVADLKKIKLDYLNTYYHSPEIDITIAPDTFQLRPSRLFDEKGDTAIISGRLCHNHFKNLRLDFGLTTNNFYCLHTKDEIGSSYFGEGYASGNVNIYGYINSIHIDANITTQKKTVFNIPMSNASEVEESDFIHFVTKKDNKTKKVKAYKVNLTGLTVDFNVHVTPDATAKVIFSSKVGDMLTGIGNGNLEIGMSNMGDFSIRGNYTVTDGTYRFVLQNVINEDFNLQPGGTIQWNGDPYNAEININTTHLVRTSLLPLQPILPGDTSRQALLKSVPVYCDLDLSGKLTSPDIKFNIELPTTDQQTQQAVSSYLQNPDEMNRQVFSLLIIKSFLPVQEGVNTTSTNAATGIIPGTAGYAILSSQLTNLINSLYNKVNIAVNYNPASTLTPQEMQLLLSTELLGGRVLINTDMSQIGTTTSGAQAENTNNVVGEVTVEYLVSKDGKLRFKAFNKANDNTIINVQNAPYTQGAGISYRESFSSWGELIEKIRARIKNSGKKDDGKASPSTE
ncbi:MAG: translocation/assembly module TamB domain-containing protein [Bacteroidia bacterium]